MQFLLISLLLTLVAYTYGKAPRPRGVAISKAPLYVVRPDFKCLDGSAKVPYDHINDDYCDCADGSDEPGTSACPHGSFHCTNAGHKPLNIPSSRVNDGICDCCDATDEYNGKGKCENTCKEMGKAAREENERLKKAIETGNGIYKEYCQEGATAKRENQEKLAKLQQTKNELEVKKNELEGAKNEAELPEKEAKDAHQKAWDEEKAKKDSEIETSTMSKAFVQLDSNKDSMVSVEEMKAHIEFDIDTNGEVSDEEAKEETEEEVKHTKQGLPYRFKIPNRKTDKKKNAEKEPLSIRLKKTLEYLEDKDSVNIAEFTTEVWPNIKSIYKSPETDKAESQQEEPSQTTVPPSTDSKRDDEDEDYDHDRYDEDEEEEDEEKEDEEAKQDETSDEMPEYDEATKLLIAAADKARADYNDMESQFKDAEKELNDVNHFLSLDLGENNEYYSLKDVCFEFTDREYTYKFCPFDQATQRSKTGGSETTLGKWGRWDGPEDNKYAVMYLDQGQNCWNGPNRSVKVIMKCGESNDLISAAEPSRCEYQFEFFTPSACHEGLLKETSPKDPDHDEL